MLAELTYLYIRFLYILLRHPRERVVTLAKMTLTGNEQDEFKESNFNHT